MFKVQTFLLKPLEYIQQNITEWIADNFYKHPDICFASLDNHSRVSELIKDEDFDPDYTMMSIIIKDTDQVLIDLKLIELNIWTDILYSLEELLQSGRSIHNLGVGTKVLILSCLDNEYVHWEINDEIGSPPTVYYDAVVNKNKLVNSLIEGGIHYYSTMLSYEVPLKESLERELRLFKKLKDLLENF